MQSQIPPSYDNEDIMADFERLPTYGRLNREMEQVYIEKLKNSTKERRTLYETLTKFEADDGGNEFKIRMLNDRLHVMNLKTQVLADRYSGMVVSNKKLLDQIEIAEKEIMLGKEYKTQLEECKFQMGVVKDSLQSRVKEINAFELELQEGKKEYKKLKQEFDRLEGMNAILQGENRELKSQLKQSEQYSQKVMEDLRSEVGTRNKDVEILKQKIQSVLEMKHEEEKKHQGILYQEKIVNKELQIQIQNFKESESKLLQQIAEKMASSQREIGVKEKEIIHLENKNEQIQVRTQQKIDEISSNFVEKEKMYHTQILDLKEKILRWEERHKNHVDLQVLQEKSIESLKEEMKVIQSKNTENATELANKLQQYHEKIEQLLMENANIIGEKKVLNLRVTQLEEELKSKQNEMKNVEIEKTREITTLENEIQNQDDSISLYQQFIISKLFAISSFEFKKKIFYKWKCNLFQQKLKKSQNSIRNLEIENLSLKSKISHRDESTQTLKIPSPSLSPYHQQHVTHDFSNPKPNLQKVEHRDFNQNADREYDVHSKNEVKRAPHEGKDNVVHSPRKNYSDDLRQDYQSKQKNEHSKEIHSVDHLSAQERIVNSSSSNCSISTLDSTKTKDEISDSSLSSTAIQKIPTHDEMQTNNIYQNNNKNSCPTKSVFPFRDPTGRLSKKPSIVPNDLEVCKKCKKPMKPSSKKVQFTKEKKNITKKSARLSKSHL